MTAQDLASRFRAPVVLGAGAVGSALAAALVKNGLAPRVVSRSGTLLGGAVSVAADISTRATAIDVLSDASIVFHTAQPPYHQWVEEFPALQESIVAGCEAAGVPLIVIDNLYGYGPVDQPMTEDLPLVATTKKGAVRAKMWQDLKIAHDQGRIQVAAIRASDFIGPGVDGSSYGDIFFGPLVKGKTVRVLGDPDARHSVTYVPDIAAAMVALAGDSTAWGRAWHAPSAPAVSQRQMAEIAAEAVGKPVKVASTPPWLLKIVGRFNKPAGELTELLYEFDNDFIIDSSAFEQRFQQQSTPLPVSLAATAKSFARAQ